MEVKKGYKSKAGLHYTVDVEVASAFHALATKKCINKSQLVESLLKQWTKDNS